MVDHRWILGVWGCLGLVAGLASAPALAADPLLRQRIDAEIRAVWQQHQVAPAPLADDATFLRRVYLDLVGIIPNYEETKRFLDDQDPNKRTKLIDQLLADPRFGLHQADVWDMVLFGRNPPGNEASNRAGFHAWLQKQFNENVAYDVWVRALFQAEGNTVDHGAPMYLVQYDRRPEDATEAITQTFLGVQLQCARCHDHPFDEWKQRDFYGMAAFLARLQTVNVGKAGQLNKIAIGEKETGDVLFSGPATDQTPGKKGEPIKPKFLHGDELQEPTPKTMSEARLPDGKMPSKPSFSRKDKLAEWITSPTNPYFAKAVANRVWGQFMGRGLAHPVDNLSDTNRPTHPVLLEILTQAMIEHQFDLKWFIRELCNSQTYQLAATGSDTTDALPRWFERARVRPLSAEELLESWRVATGYEDALKQAGQKIPEDRFHGITWGYMIRFFGTPNNGVGDFQGGLHEHLFLNNGQVGQLITPNKGGLHNALMSTDAPWDQRVERLFLSVLNRPPRPQERAKFVAFLDTSDDQPGRVSEAIWALMTCSEFRFNH
ncbi:MAG: DUF1549 domain-containing protein [Gemmataceae bacterium]